MRLLTISQHPEETFNNTYRIIKIYHYGDQSSGDNQGLHKVEQGLRYYNKLIVLPVEVTYQPSFSYAHVNTYLTAMIQGHNPDEPFLDEKGNYHIKYDFDDCGDSIGITTPLLQSFTGEGLGFHLPLKPNTKVIVGGMQGDLCQPVILGVIPNTPIVTAENSQQYIMRSNEGSQWLMDDASKAIAFSTKDDAQYLTFSEGAGVSLENAQGDISVSSDSHFTIKAKGSYSQKSEGDGVASVQKNYHAFTQWGSISYKAQDHILWKVQGSFTMNTANFNVQTQGDLSMNVREEITWQVKQAPLALTMKTGSFQSEGAITLQAAQEITLTNGQATIKLTPTSIVISANRILCDGQISGLQGQRVTFS